MRILLLVLLAWQTIAHASLVKVSSIYSDESNSARQLRVNGTGLIFTSGGTRTFVITASHVSQGNGGASVELNGSTLKILGRAMSGSSDLELFEVSGADLKQIAASYDGKWIRFNVAQGQRRRWI